MFRRNIANGNCHLCKQTTTNKLNDNYYCENCLNSQADKIETMVDENIEKIIPAAPNENIENFAILNIEFTPKELTTYIIIIILAIIYITINIYYMFKIIDITEKVSKTINSRFESKSWIY